MNPNNADERNQATYKGNAPIDLLKQNSPSAIANIDSDNESDYGDEITAWPGGEVKDRSDYDRILEQNMSSFFSIKPIGKSSTVQVESNTIQFQRSPKGKLDLSTIINKAVFPK